MSQLPTLNVHPPPGFHELQQLMKTAKKDFPNLAPDPTTDIYKWLSKGEFQMKLHNFGPQKGFKLGCAGGLKPYFSDLSRVKRKLAADFHPDKGGGHAVMICLNAAVDLLQNHEKAYKQYLEALLKAQKPQNGGKTAAPSPSPSHGMRTQGAGATPTSRFKTFSEREEFFGKFTAYCSQLIRLTTDSNIFKASMQSEMENMAKTFYMRTMEYQKLMSEWRTCQYAVVTSEIRHMLYTFDYDCEYYGIGPVDDRVAFEQTCDAIVEDTVKSLSKIKISESISHMSADYTNFRDKLVTDLKDVDKDPTLGASGFDVWKSFNLINRLELDIQKTTHDKNKTAYLTTQLNTEKAKAMAAMVTQPEKSKKRLETMQTQAKELMAKMSETLGQMQSTLAAFEGGLKAQAALVPSLLENKKKFQKVVRKILAPARKLERERKAVGGDVGSGLGKRSLGEAKVEAGVGGCDKQKSNVDTVEKKQKTEAV